MTAWKCIFGEVDTLIRLGKEQVFASIFAACKPNIFRSENILRSSHRNQFYLVLILKKELKSSTINNK